jgi:hypothetical protein
LTSAKWAKKGHLGRFEAKRVFPKAQKGAKLPSLIAKMS